MTNMSLPSAHVQVPKSMKTTVLPAWVAALRRHALAHKKRRLAARLMKVTWSVKQSKHQKDQKKAKREPSAVEYYDHPAFSEALYNVVNSSLGFSRSYNFSWSRSSAENRRSTAEIEIPYAYKMATMPLTGVEADVIASRARTEARRLVGPDGKLAMQELKSMLKCSSLQLARSIMSHLPYQLLVDLRSSDYGRHIGLDKPAYPIITGDVLNSALLAADQRERVFWLNRAVPFELEGGAIALDGSKEPPIPPPPLNPHASRAVCVFGANGPLANSQWFEHRSLDFEEAKHPSVDPARVSYGIEQRGGRHATIGPSVVRTFHQFDTNLWAFTHGILQGVLGRGAVLGGSAVMAALIDAGRPALLQSLLVRRLRNSQACLYKIFDFAGLSTDSLQNRFDGRSSPFRSADLDIYFVADSKVAAADRLIAALKRVVANMEAFGPVVVVETPNALTVCGAWPLRHVQLVTHVRESVDELLSFVDIDCTASVFDGRKVWMAPRAVRSFSTGYNFVTPRMISRRRGTVQRAAKYCRRGFGMLMFELCKHMPRCDVKVEDEVSKALNATASLVHHKAAPPGPREISDALQRCQAPGNDTAAVGATIAKVMRRMQHAGESILPRGPGIGARAVQAYVKMLPFLVEAGFLRSPPLKEVCLQVSQLELLEKLVWHRRTCANWVEWGMVPSAPWRRSPGSTCYQCRQQITVPSLDAGAYDSSSANSRRVKVCDSCAALNSSKRAQVIDLTGMTAIVTGGRAKIGYEIAVKLLQSGALVVVTTRFPHLAAVRFASDSRTASSIHRLHIYGVDFRHLRSMTDFCDQVLEHYPAIEIMVHNAAQTVRRPPAYYRELFAEERNIVDHLHLHGDVARIVKVIAADPHNSHDPVNQQSHYVPKVVAHAHRQRNDARRTMALELSTFSNASSAPTHVAELLRRAQAAVEEARMNGGAATDPIAALFSSALAVVPLLPSDREAELRQDEWFPASLRDMHGEPLDLRAQTSWTAPLDQVPLLELMEVLIVNSVAPFLLTSRLLPNLRAAAHKSGGCGGAFVVNVSSSEGIFDPSKPKGSEHPHTNMGKAALNMLTRTIAEDLSSQGVFVSSADTGWISQMRPNPKVLPPLTEEDGAARVLDPVITGMGVLQRGELPAHGVLFQHFKVVDW